VTRGRVGRARAASWLNFATARPITPAMSGSTFRFSLERIRALRESTEDEAKEALAGAMQEQLRSERGVHDAAQAVQRARDAQRDVATGPVDVTQLIARQAFLERSEQAQIASQEMLQRSQARVARRREVLTEAARDRQALEKLKEHRRSDHEREVARQEAVALDEIALNTFRRGAA
jgi:flagellar protein FliJ